MCESEAEKNSATKEISVESFRNDDTKKKLQTFDRIHIWVNLIFFRRQGLPTEFEFDFFLQNFYKIENIKSSFRCCLSSSSFFCSGFKSLSKKIWIILTGNNKNYINQHLRAVASQAAVYHHDRSLIVIGV